MRKQWTWVGLLLLVCLALQLAACTPAATTGTTTATTAPTQTTSGTQTSPTTTVDENDVWLSDSLVIKYLYYEDPRTPYNANWPWVSYSKERTGVTLEIINVLNSDYDAKLQALIASGDPPDFISNTGAAYRAYFNDNMWVPISDYWDYMPNFKKVADLNNAWDAIDEFREDDGKFYLMPEIRAFTVNNRQFFLRADLMEKSGITEKPTTLDAFTNAIRTLVQDNEGTKGIGLVDGLGAFGNLVGRMFNDTKMAGNLGTDYGLEWDGSKWIYGPASEKSRAALTWMRLLVSENLLDVETFNLPREQIRSNMSNGLYIGNFCYYSDTAVAESAGKPVFGDDFAYTVIVPPKTSYGRAYSTGANGKWQYNFNLTTNALKKHGEEDFIKIVRFLDWFRYSDEMWNRYTYGVEGETYDMVEGKPVLRPHVKSAENPEGTLELEKEYGCGVLPFRGYTILERELASYKPEYQEYQVLTAEKGYILPPLKAFSLDIDQQDLVNQYAPGLKTYVEEMTMKFIMGDLELNDANWAAFAQECERYGTDKLIRLFTEVAPQGR